MQLDNTTYLGWFASIIALDAMSALPYAKLRRENRPRKYAATKVMGIIAYVVTIVFLFTFGDEIAASMPDSFFCCMVPQILGYRLYTVCQFAAGGGYIVFVVERAADVSL